MPRTYQGWLSLTEAATRLGLKYEAARRMVAAGIFTPGRFSLAKKKPPIYLRVEEVDAWMSGGLDAVRAVQAARKARKSRKPSGV